MLIKWLADSQYWIALAAVAISAHSLRQFGLGVAEYGGLFAFLFGSTLVTYVYLRLRQYPNHRFLKFNLALGCVITLTSLWFLPFQMLWLAGLAGIIVAGYIFPIPGLNKSLRQIPYLKVMVISLVWAIMTVGLPWLYVHTTETEVFPWLLFAARFLFVGAITLPFDLRDRELDQQEGIITFPLAFGWPMMRKISLIALVISGMLETLYWWQGHMPFEILLSGLLALLPTGFLLVMTNIRRNDAFYTFWLDGTLMLPLLFYTIITFGKG